MSPLEPCGSGTKSVTAQAGAPLPPAQLSLSLRQALRQRRKALSEAAQLDHAFAVSQRILASHWLKDCRHLGLYLAADGEIDLGPLLTTLSTTSIRCYLPVLKPGRQRQLWFAGYRLGDRLRPNRFGILEPDTNRQPPQPLRQLDLILMPLVGFDPQLNRLGMGGGYYDRSLAFLRHSQWRRPRLIGIAHECQRVAQLSPAPWDIPMDAVATEARLYTSTPFLRRP